MPRYSTDFKEQAVCLLHQVGISKACRELHITRATLYRWNKELKEVSSFSKEKLISPSNTIGSQAFRSIESSPMEDIDSSSWFSSELEQLREEVNAQIKLNRKLKKALLTILSDGEDTLCKKT